MNSGISQIELLEIFKFFLPRITGALLCGFIIGIERELRNKSAGLKTNILISLGATIYTGISILISESMASKGFYGDPARLAAQIIPGVGFIGGGVIIQSKGGVIGLTTAASIWLMAAIGICNGVGQMVLAIIISILTVVALTAVSTFENRILRRQLSFISELVLTGRGEDARNHLQRAIVENELMIDEFDIQERDNGCRVMLRYRGSLSDQKKFVLSLWALPGMKEVRQV